MTIQGTALDDFEDTRIQLGKLKPGIAKTIRAGAEARARSSVHSIGRVVTNRRPITLPRVSILGDDQ